LAHGHDRLARRFREPGEHPALLLGHDEDDVRLLEQVALALQIRRTGAGGELDADLAQHETRVERDEAAVARGGRDAAGADLPLAGMPVLGEEPLENLLRDDAAARVRVADDQDAARRTGRSAHSPPTKMSFIVSGAVMPFPSSALMAAPSFAGSHAAG